MLDVQAIRSRTPGCEDRIHLNSAGSSLPSVGVLEAQVDYLEAEAQLGGYEMARTTRPAFEAVYDSVATLIGAHRDEIALVENATQAWHQAFHSIDLGPGDRILTAEAEYASNYISYLQVARSRGATIDVVPSDDHGQLDVDALDAMLDERVRLVSVTHIPTNGGLVNPAEAIGHITGRAGVPFLLDACQSVGQIDLDVGAIGCDFLTATGRKYLRGPRGTGFLFVSSSILDRVEPPFLDLHGAEWAEADRYELLPNARRFENWEFNHSAVRGLGRAVDEAIELGMPEIESRVVELGEALRDRLRSAALPVYDLGARRGGIVTTAVPGQSSTEVSAALFERGINSSVSSAASTRLDADRRHLPELLRLSVHVFNTLDELDETVEALTALSH